MMRILSQKLFLIAGLALLTLALLGCPEQTTIGQINADPGRFMNKEVAVSGTVAESFGVLNKGVYQLDDGTGRLWVFSDKYGVPTQGAQVRVAGRITPTVTFSGRSFTNILRESERRR